MFNLLVVGNTQSRKTILINELIYNKIINEYIPTDIKIYNYKPNKIIIEIGENMI